MENTTNEVVTVLTTKVENFKLIARNALRMNLINPRLTKIASYNSMIEGLNKTKNEVNHKIDVKTYEMSKLDTEHPDYADKKKVYEDAILDSQEYAKVLDNEIEEVNTVIKEQQEGINKIETGETKVSLEDLNNLVSDLIKEDARNQVRG
jgi:hypothetical protein